MLSICSYLLFVSFNDLPRGLLRRFSISERTKSPVATSSLLKCVKLGLIREQDVQLSRTRLHFKISASNFHSDDSCSCVDCDLKVIKASSRTVHLRYFIWKFYYSRFHPVWWLVSIIYSERDFPNLFRCWLICVGCRIPSSKKCGSSDVVVKLIEVMQTLRSLSSLVWRRTADYFWAWILNFYFIVNPYVRLLR